MNDPETDTHPAFFSPCPGIPSSSSSPHPSISSFPPSLAPSVSEPRLLALLWTGTWAEKNKVRKQMRKNNLAFKKEKKNVNLRNSHLCLCFLFRLLLSEKLFQRQRLDLNGSKHRSNTQNNNLRNKNTKRFSQTRFLPSLSSFFLLPPPLFLYPSLSLIWHPSTWVRDFYRGK